MELLNGEQRHRWFTLRWSSRHCWHNGNERQTYRFRTDITNHWSVSLAHEVTHDDISKTSHAHVLLHTFYSYLQPHNEMLIFNVNHTAATALLQTSSLYCCWQKIFSQKTNYFSHINSTFSLLYCLKVSFKLVEIFAGNMQENNRLFFF